MTDNAHIARLVKASSDVAQYYNRPHMVCQAEWQALLEALKPFLEQEALQKAKEDVVRQRVDRLRQGLQEAIQKGLSVRDAEAYRRELNRLAHSLGLEATNG